jgi:L-seryl-tRNA(Ser) seleniumtransferase
MTKPNQRLPAVGILLQRPDVSELCERYSRELVTYAVRQVLARAREESTETPLSEEELLHRAKNIIKSIAEPSLKKVVNATGIVLHTNLGRAPLGEAVVEDIASAAGGYCNIEFDLASGRRGKRTTHLRPVLQYLTGAEDIVVVNNNAAAIILALYTLARDREVIISRGELIEIGGSFRIPEIMAAGGAHMVEVGATNRTRLSDYAGAITDNTALLFKAHKSNYSITGFTEEVEVKELARLAREKGIPFVYDIGSGLLRKPGGVQLQDEPDVQSAISAGADLVTFSCDKLLGGPQAGIVAGKREYISRLAAAPLMRALRVGKLSVAALSSACRHYLNDRELVEKNPTFAILESKIRKTVQTAEILSGELSARGVQNEIIPSDAQVGGGTLPELTVKSHAVRLVPPDRSVKKRSQFAEERYFHLLQSDVPVVGILRDGYLCFDSLTLEEREIPTITQALCRE